MVGRIIGQIVGQIVGYIIGQIIGQIVGQNEGDIVSMDCTYRRIDRRTNPRTDRRTYHGTDSFKVCRREHKHIVFMIKQSVITRSCTPADN